MLVMPVKPGAAGALKQALGSLDRDALERKLTKVGTVHTTRFVVLEDEDRQWAKLIVLAMYDGSVDDYIGAFARELNDEFNALFGFVEDTDDKPNVPVRTDVDRFIKYVENRDVKPEGRAYKAYPGFTALDIYEVTRPAS